MSRVEDRLRRDLHQIADRAAPSPTAWDAIRSRIDSQEPAEETEIIMLTEDRPTTRRRRLVLGLAAAAAAVAVIVGVTLVAQDDETEVTTASDATQVTTASDATQVSTASDVTPADVLDAYIAAFNADDLDAVMALFADDAVVLNDPVTGTLRAEGIDEVRDVQSAEISFGESYEVVSVDSVGNTATFGRRIRTPSGRCYAGTNKVTVERGKIVRWDVLTHSQPCPQAASDSVPSAAADPARAACEPASVELVDAVSLGLAKEHGPGFLDQAFVVETAPADRNDDGHPAHILGARINGERIPEGTVGTWAVGDPGPIMALNADAQEFSDWSAAAGPPNSPTATRIQELAATATAATAETCAGG
jgi:hypothetical protein